MDIKRARILMAQIIHEVIQGEIEPTKIGERYPELMNIRDESLDRVFHAIGHYVVDSDIRGKDKAYEELQEKALVAMADRLSKGLPLTNEHGYW